jgi:hypothetical protein
LWNLLGVSIVGLLLLLILAQVLEEAFIKHSGAGLLSEARRPALLDKGGFKVAFLSYSDHYDSWAATEERHGINYINPER